MKEIITKRGKLIIEEPEEEEEESEETEEPEKEVMKRIEIRLPEKLHDQLKIKFGHKLSKIMRETFQQILNKKELELEKFKVCHLNCDLKNKNYSVKDLYVSSFIEYNEGQENYENRRFIVCPDCRDHLLNVMKSVAEKIKRKEKLSEAEETGSILGVLLTKSPNDCVWLSATLCKYYPNNYKLEEATIISTRNSKETKEDMDKLEEQGLLYPIA